MERKETNLLESLRATFFFQFKDIYYCKRHINMHNIYNKVSYSIFMDSGPSSVDSLVRVEGERLGGE